MCCSESIQEEKDSFQTLALELVCLPSSVTSTIGTYIEELAIGPAAQRPSQCRRIPVTFHFSRHISPNPTLSRPQLDGRRWHLLHTAARPQLEGWLKPWYSNLCCSDACSSSTGRDLLFDYLISSSVTTSLHFVSIQDYRNNVKVENTHHLHYLNLLLVIASFF